MKRDKKMRPLNLYCQQLEIKQISVGKSEVSHQHI